MENLKNKKIGRPRVELTDEFIGIWKKWKTGEITKTVEAMRLSNTSKSTFYRFNKILENMEEIKE